MSSIFTNIDERLESLSSRVGGELKVDRPEYPEALRTFEERRADWSKEGGILRSVIIQPTFRREGVDSTKWNFISLAWIIDGRNPYPKQMNVSVKEKPFEIIEDKIDQLIEDAEKELESVSVADLQ